MIRDTLLQSHAHLHYPILYMQPLLLIAPPALDSVAMVLSETSSYATMQ